MTPAYWGPFLVSSYLLDTTLVLVPEVGTPHLFQTCPIVSSSESDTGVVSFKNNGRPGQWWGITLIPVCNLGEGTAGQSREFRSCGVVALDPPATAPPFLFRW